MPEYDEEQWQAAKKAVIAEYDTYREQLHERGVDYTIDNAREILIYQDLIAEWNHRIKTIMSDLEANPFALTLFDELKRNEKSTLLQRAYKRIATWRDFEPTALVLWLELQEDASIA